jgi:hypothetical protein
MAACLVETETRGSVYEDIRWKPGAGLRMVKYLGEVEER